MARACATVFLREGAKVLAADISGREEETASDLGDAVVPCHVDVAEDPKGPRHQGQTCRSSILASRPGSEFLSLIARAERLHRGRTSG